MRELSLDRLRTLVAVADLGSFAAAARALHRSPPAVTLHVAELEARLGTALLVREPRVAPTGAGTVLIERARRLLADVEAAEQAVRAHVDGRAGTVRLGASTGVIAHQLPPVLRRLSRERPGIDLQVQVSTSEATLAALVAGALDLGVVALPQAPVAGIEIRPWRRDPILAWLPADWPAPRMLTPDWLAERPLILNDASTRLSRQVAGWFARAGHAPTPRIALNYNDAIRSLVAAGWGATLLPDEEGTATPGRTEAGGRIAVRRLKPALWRELGLAFRGGSDDGTIGTVLAALVAEARPRSGPSRAISAGRPAPA